MSHLIVDSSRQVSSIWTSLAYLLIIPILFKLLPANANAAIQCKNLLSAAVLENTMLATYKYSENKSIQDNLSSFAITYQTTIDWGRSITHQEYFPSPINNNFRSVGLMFGKYEDPQIGGYLVLENSDEQSSKKTININSNGIFSTAHTLSELLGEKWSYEGKKFNFINIGTRALLKDVNIDGLISRISTITEKDSGASIRVAINAQFSDLLTVINSRQSAASDRAIQNYYDKKELTDHELFQLSIHDRYSKDNNDFFVLTKDTGKNPLMMNEAEFQQNMIAMLRVARFTQNTDPLLKRILGWMPHLQDLPFADRTKGDLRITLRKFFEQISQKGDFRIAELSRLNRFYEFPESVMDAFMLKVYELAKNQEAPIDLFILRCDKARARLFSQSNRYGFKKLVKLSDDGDPNPEYLMYLDTRSQAYETAISSLKAGAKTVLKVKEENHRPPSQWNASQKGAQSILNYMPDQKLKITKDAVLDLRTKMTESFGDKKNKTIEQQHVIFTDQFMNLALYITSRANSRESILILGENAEMISELIKVNFPERNVFTAKNVDEIPSNLKIKTAVVLNNLASETGEISQNSLQKLASIVEPRGRAIFVENFFSDQVDSSMNYKNNIQNTGRRPVNIKLFLQSASENGFRIDKYLSSNSDIFGGRGIELDMLDN